MPGAVGFIGLGAMGSPMALNLVKLGFSLVAHDIDPAKAELWRARGATIRLRRRQDIRTARWRAGRRQR